MIRAALASEITDVRRAPEQDVRADGHVARDDRHLWHERHGARDVLAGEAARVLVKDAHASLVADEPCNRTKGSRLAGAVRPDQRDPLSVLDDRGQTIDDTRSAEGDRESIERERAHARARVVRRTTA